MPGMSFLNFMNTHVGRGIRVAMGAALIVIGLVIGGGLGIGLAIFGLAPIATGLFGLCPVNPLFGKSMRACAIPKQS